MLGMIAENIAFNCTLYVLVTGKYLVGGMDLDVGVAYEGWIYKKIDWDEYL